MNLLHLCFLVNFVCLIGDANALTIIKDRSIDYAAVNFVADKVVVAINHILSNFSSSVKAPDVPLKEKGVHEFEACCGSFEGVSKVVRNGNAVVDKIDRRTVAVQLPITFPVMKTHYRYRSREYYLYGLLGLLRQKDVDLRYLHTFKMTITMTKSDEANKPCKESAVLVTDWKTTDLKPCENTIMVGSAYKKKSCEQLHENFENFARDLLLKVLGAAMKGPAVKEVDLCLVFNFLRRTQH